MKRIVFINFGEPIPTDPGFVGARYSTVASELVKRGHQPIRIAPSFNHRSRAFRRPGAFESEEFGKIVVIPTAGYSKSRSIARILSIRDFRRGILCHVKKINPHVVVLAINPPGFVKQLRKTLSQDATVILDIRDIFPDAQLATSNSIIKTILNFTKPFFRNLSRNDFFSVNGIITLSSGYTKWVRDIGVPLDANIMEIPLGAPEAILSSLTASERRSVVYVGSLSRILDFTLLLDAWAILENQFPELAKNNPLLIIGAGEMSSYIKNRIEELKHAYIQGYLDQTQVGKLMREARVGVAPYASGNFHTIPNKIFDYIAAGLPVVASIGGDAERLIQTEGVGAARRDANTSWFVEQIVDLLSNDVKWMKASAATRLSWEKYNRTKLAKVYCDFILK